MKKPNFFIIGAPKSGTTALAQYLGEHPRIFFCPGKEPHYFNFDWSNRLTRSREAYLGLFEKATDLHIAVGEGSTSYLVSDVAVQEILKFNKDARFIVMVRNPVEMAPALHAEELFQYQEYVTDFEKAWHLQEERRGGLKVPKFVKEWRVLMYGERCRVGEQLERLLRIVPRERVKLIVFDDFIADPGRIYQEVLDFLSVPSDKRENFPRVNARKTPRSRTLDILVQRGLWLKRSMGISRGFGLAEKLRHANFRKADPMAMAMRMRKELCTYFARDIELLSQLLDRDLTDWLISDHKESVS